MARIRKPGLISGLSCPWHKVPLVARLPLAEIPARIPPSQQSTAPWNPLGTAEEGTQSLRAPEAGGVIATQLGSGAQFLAWSSSRTCCDHPARLAGRCRSAPAASRGLSVSALPAACCSAPSWTCCRLHHHHLRRLLLGGPLALLQGPCRCRWYRHAWLAGLSCHRPCSQHCCPRVAHTPHLPHFPYQGLLHHPCLQVPPPAVRTPHCLPCPHFLRLP